MVHVSVTRGWVLASFLSFSSYVGEACDLQCPGLIEDESGVVDVCNGNGKCEVSKGPNPEAVCKCSHGLFTGANCTAACPNTYMDAGSLIMCDEHGVCENDNCECRMGWYGEGCDQSCPGLIEHADGVLECNGNGKCNTDTFQCECNQGDFIPETCGD